MLTNLRNRMLAIAMVGTLWLGSYCGCDVNSVYLGGCGVYDAVVGYVTEYDYYEYGTGYYDYVEYDAGCCGGGYEFYVDGGYTGW